MVSFLCRLPIALIFLAMISHAKASQHTIIVIPGMMGSRLCDINNDIVWGDRLSYTQDRINLLRLPPPDAINGVGKVLHSCGFVESVSVIPLFWEVDVYDALFHFLATDGFKDANIIKFDYDWRLSNFVNAARLQTEIATIPPTNRIDIIAHSMGGIIARIYYQSLGGMQRVNSVIMIGTPHYGSAKIFERLKDGFDDWPNILSGGLEEIQKTILSFPSTYQLLPTYTQCCGFSEDGNPTNARYEDIMSFNTWMQLAIPQDFKTGKYMRALNLYLKDARRLRTILHTPITTNPARLDKLHYIANGFIDTWSRVFFSPLSGRVVHHTEEAGDGTVLFYSATNGAPEHFQLALKEHEQLFAGKEPELAITSALTNKRWTSSSSGFVQSFLDKNGKEFKLHSLLFDVSPRTTLPGQKLKIDVKLGGDDDLIDADLSDLHIDLPTSTRAGLQPQPETLTSDKSIRRVTWTFTAPQEPGAYKLQLRLSGTEPISIIFGVVNP